MNEFFQKVPLTFYRELKAIHYHPRSTKMSFILKIILILASFLLMQFQLCLASERDSIVWLSDGVSINSLKQIEFYPISYDMGESYDHDPSLVIKNIIEAELESAGIKIVYIKENTKPKHFALKIYLVHYQPGDVGSRWIGFGGGSAICILRTKIISGPTGKVDGEIIVAKQVSKGGLFSAGADKYVPERVAKQTANELADLLGMKLDSGGIEEQK